MANYKLGDDVVHYEWRSDLSPVLKIESGDRVTVRTRDGFDGQLLPPISATDLNESLDKCIDFKRVAPLTGPIFIKGATPGDVLSVRIDQLRPLGIGTLVVWPASAGFDFLEKDYRIKYERGYIKHFNFNVDNTLQESIWINECKVPIRPMLGMMGTAPSMGVYRTGQPREFGGNMDVKLLGPGATVHLPVFVEGGLFSLGDGHAVQGDGELCTTGVEAAMEAKLTFAVQTGVSIIEPHVETSDIYAILATGKTLDEASKKALQYTLDWLIDKHHFTFSDAYMLLGIAADIKICQIANYPALGIRIEIPKKIYNASIWKI